MRRRAIQEPARFLALALIAALLQMAVASCPCQPTAQHASGAAAERCSDNPAQDPFEIHIYEYEPMALGQYSLEAHLNVMARGAPSATARSSRPSIRRI